MTFPLMPLTGFGDTGALYIKGTSVGAIGVGDILVLYQSKSAGGRSQGGFFFTSVSVTTSYTTMASDTASVAGGESPGGYTDWISIAMAIRIKVAEAADVGLTQANTTKLYVIGSSDPNQTLSHTSQATGSVDFDSAPGFPVGCVYAGLRASGANTPTIPGSGTVTNQVADVAYGHSLIKTSGALSDISGAARVNVFHNSAEGTIPGTETIANGTSTDSRSWQLIYGVV